MSKENGRVVDGKEKNAKDTLIQVASLLFQRQGYHATGVNQIIKESKIPKGSLYYYFPGGKEEIAMEAVKRNAAFVTDRIQDSLQQIQEPALAIEHLINSLGEQFLSAQGTMGVPIASVALETALISDSLRAACTAAYEAFEVQFSEKLRQSGYQEELANELGMVINSMMEGAFIVSLTKGNLDPLHAVSRQIKILLRK